MKKDRNQDNAKNPDFIPPVDLPGATPEEYISAQKKSPKPVKRNKQDT